MKKILIILLIYFAGVSCNNSEKKKTSLKIGAETVASNDQDPLKKSMERGAVVYSDFCMQCHMADGKGIPGNFPPLANSNWLSEKRTESIHAVKYGQQGEITVNGVVYNGVMAPMGLSDQEVADVLNYVMNSWGNSQTKPVTKEEVAAVAK
ncbi:cytochrome c [Altibacter sp.]|uniref:c-type cytochrome n=1 Tax=Altibacter sp. TaxID=2024823 RepID=UPI0025878596|nr:cytochrome c [Altibacter sp.]MCW9037705.1 cytochrome c [Altibacter sp.]